MCHDPLINLGVPWVAANVILHDRWNGAVGEAVALIGYERNADRIIGAAYVSTLPFFSLWKHADMYWHLGSHPTQHEQVAVVNHHAAICRGPGFDYSLNELVYLGGECWHKHAEWAESKVREN